MKKVDYTGRTYGLLTVTEFNPDNNSWKCNCKCGKVVFYTSKQLQNNKPKSCGCLNSPDLTGKVFDRLIVIKRTDKRDDNYNVYYLCQCECGNTKMVTATDLNKGNVRSCGCLSEEHNKRTGLLLGKKTVEQCIDGTNVRNLTMRTPKRNTSGYKGVCWDKSRNKWLAQIRFKGKNYNLGRYTDIRDAVKVRKQAEDKLFGEFLEWYYQNYTKGAEYNEKRD